jgi:acyl-CoA dehydrogenase
VVRALSGRVRRRGLSLLGQAVVAEEAAKCRMGAYVPACGAFGADPPNAI